MSRTMSTKPTTDQTTNQTTNQTTSRSSYQPTINRSRSSQLYMKPTQKTSQTTDQTTDQTQQVSRSQSDSKFESAMEQLTSSHHETYSETLHLKMNGQSLQTTAIPTFKMHKYVESPFLSKVGRKPKARESTGVEKPKWKDTLVRVTYYDERQKKNNMLVQQPRVVTVVWSYNRDLGLLRYGADVWTALRPSDTFCKTTERDHAQLRYDYEPVFVRFDPAPQKNKDILQNIRWVIHKLGTSSKSRRYMKYEKKQYENK